MDTTHNKLPVIRSGDLFTRFSGADQDNYFDAVATMPGTAVQPEALYGTNGWRRRLKATGADPELAAKEFRRQWDSIGFADRRDALVSNAVARFYGTVIGDDIMDVDLKEREAEARMLTRDPVTGILALDDPVELSRQWQEKLFGTRPDYSGVVVSEMMQAEGPQ